MRARGFTLTELVLILVLIGIMAAFVAPRLDIQGFERQSYARELTIALRYAQRIAMAAACPVDVQITASGYAVSWGGGSPECGTDALPHPSRGGQFSGTGETTAVITPVDEQCEARDGADTIQLDSELDPEPSITIRFDEMGRNGDGFSIGVAGGTTVCVESGSGYVRS